MAKLQIIRTSLGLGFLLISAGLGLSQQPLAPVPPVFPPPAPTHPPTAPGPAPTIDAADLEKAAMSQFRQSLKSGEQRIVVRTTCVSVPKGFCERIGLNLVCGCGDKPATRGQQWVLTPREARMLDLLIKSETQASCFTRPTLVLTDDQAGVFQVSQKLDLVTGLDALTKDGVTVFTPRTGTFNAGITLRVTPKVASDGKSMMLKIAASQSHLADATVSIPVFMPSTGSSEPGSKPQTRLAFWYDQPAVDIQAIETTVALPNGGTVVLGGQTTETASKGQPKPAETLWILTAEVVEGPGCTPPPAVK